jgi:AAHS family 4-hydroxybenzoate transporter-like MFS transporter
MQAQSVNVDVEKLIDESPVGKLQILVAFLGTLVIFADGFNIQVMGYIAPQLAKAWHIPHELLGPIFSSGLFGVFAGYLFLAPISARVGHRRMMIGTTAIFGILTLLTTLVSDAYALMAVRFLTGLALGASNPSAVSIIADFCPKSRRSTFIVIGICGVSLGSMSAGLAAVLLTEKFGWESVLIVGGIFPLLVSCLLAATLPDSLEYVVKKQGGDSPAALALARRIAPKQPLPEGSRLVVERPVSSAVSEVFVSGRLAGTLAVWLGFAMNLLVYYFVQSWLTILVIQAGHPQQVALTATTVLLAGGALSIFAFGPLMDRFQPFKVIAVFFIIGGAAVAFLGSVLTSSTTAIMIAAFLTGFFVLGVQKGMNAIAVFFYPTSLRSTGLGWGLGIGRLGAVAGPLIAGLLMGGGEATARLFYFAAAPMLIGAASMFFMLLRYGNARLAQPEADTKAVASVTALS